MSEDFTNLSADEKFRLLKANEIGFEAFGLKVDPELIFLSKILQSGEVKSALDAGVSSDWFRTQEGKPPYREMWEWVKSYHEEHGACPTIDAFTLKHGTLGLQDVSVEPYSAIVKHFREVSRKRLAADVLNAAHETVKNGEVSADQVFRLMEQAVEKDYAIRSHAPRVSNLVNVDQFDAMIDKLVAERGTYPGVISGYPGLDNLTRGFRPEQLVTIVGEKKRGKSFLLLNMARHAFEHGKVPAFVSIEMGEQEILLRLAAMMSNVPLSAIINGTLTPKEQKRVKDANRIRKEKQPFITNCDRSRTRNIDDLRRLVEIGYSIDGIHYCPDILYVDGAYLLQDNQVRRREVSTTERLMALTQGLKELAQDMKIPVVLTTQAAVYKMNKSTRDVDEDAAAWSSSYGQDSDLLLGYQRDPEDATKSLLKILLARTHASGRVIRTNWDFDTMDFDQIGWFQEDTDTEPYDEGWFQ